MNSPQESPRLSPSGSLNGSLNSSPRRSRASSKASHLTLDLSNLPPLTQPAEPTNTILITNLNNPEIFAPEHLKQLYDIISSVAPLASWSPLKSFRRIMCVFATTEAAIEVRKALDGECIMNDRTRVYFGSHTKLEPTDQHLQAPESKKLFFISPPPSPPHGWEVRNEEPPNNVIVAEDLAHALAKLSYEPSKLDETLGEASREPKGTRGRSRSGSSVVLFEPEQGGETQMPAISVDDYTDSGDERSPVSPITRKSLHTARPPIELVEHA